MRIKSLIVGFTLSVACAAPISVIIGRTLLAQTPAPGGGGRRAAPPPRPGAPAPIVGGLRPPVLGSQGGVSSGHPLTSAAGMEILLKGGNAFDAGVAAILVGGIVEQDLFGLGGE